MYEWLIIKFLLDTTMLVIYFLLTAFDNVSHLLYISTTLIIWQSSLFFIFPTNNPFLFYPHFLLPSISSLSLNLPLLKIISKISAHLDLPLTFSSVSFHHLSRFQRILYPSHLLSDLFVCTSVFHWVEPLLFIRFKIKQHRHSHLYQPRGRG